MSRRVVWFSCGAASAVAAKITVDGYPDSEVVYCDTSVNEHPDNLRFFADVEKWIRKPITVIRSGEYKSVDEVFAKRRYMSGIAGAPCTVELKKVPRFAYQRADDIHIFGYTFEERRRIERLREANPELALEWPLYECHLTKTDCLSLLREAGIALPTMYLLGFKNNNCIGCVKASSPAYWNLVRQHFPLVFERRMSQEQQLGAKLTRVKSGKRWIHSSLSHLLPSDATDFAEDLSCGPECKS